MIHFRYHLVSLVAVFLALAVGIVMGSTVIDRAIVDGLRSRIDQVEANADARRAENARLGTEIDRLGRYVSASAPFAVTNRLSNRNVVVFAMTGTDERPVRDAVQLIRTAGGRASGIVWVEDDMALDNDELIRRVATSLGLNSTDAGAVRDAAWDYMARAMRPLPVPPVEVEDPSTPVTTTQPPAATMFNRLVELGLLRFEGVGEGSPLVGTLAGADALMVSDSRLDEEVDAVALAGLRALVRADIATVAAEVFRADKGGPERGDGLAPIHDDPVLANAVSTVDDLELIEGHVAAVLALSDLARGVVGRYGFGPDTQPLPEWSQP